MFAQIGAWVEGTAAKRDGKGLRKVWVTGASAAGEPARLSVIAGEGDRVRHVLTLHVDTAEQRMAALEALTAATDALLAYDEHVSKPAPAPAPITRKAPKPPTPPKPTAPAPLIAAPDTRPLTGRVRNPAPVAAPAPEAADWFAQIMAQAGAN